MGARILAKTGKRTKIGNWMKTSLPAYIYNLYICYLYDARELHDPPSNNSNNSNIFLLAWKLTEETKGTSMDENNDPYLADAKELLGQADDQAEKYGRNQDQIIAAAKVAALISIAETLDELATRSTLTIREW